MDNPEISRPLPFFRVIALGLLIIVSRIMKWVIPAIFLLAVIVWLVPVANHLMYNVPLKAMSGKVLTLTEVLYSMGKAGVLAVVFFFLGEGLIRLNERFARSLARYMGEDLDKI